MEIIFLKDRDWRVNDGRLSLIREFKPFLGSKVENGMAITVDSSIPYASVEFVSHNLPNQATGFITHKEDFINLWKVFNDRGIASNEEVIFYWSTKHYKSKIVGFLSKMLPKMAIYVVPSGTYQTVSDMDLPKVDTANVMYYALAAKDAWIPEIMT